MMLPGVELARRRRLHHHEVAPPAGTGGAGASSSSAALFGERMTEPALAAKLRLEERLHGRIASSGSPESLPYYRRWGRHSRGSRNAQISNQESDARNNNQEAPRSPVSEASIQAMTTHRREFSRTLSRIDTCAVCLEDVDMERQVTRLPCSHKYHTDCVLPWLAAHPDCPCCRTLVPSVDSLLL